MEHLRSILSHRKPANIHSAFDMPECMFREAPSLVEWLGPLILPKSVSMVPGWNMVFWPCTSRGLFVTLVVLVRDNWRFAYEGLKVMKHRLKYHPSVDYIKGNMDFFSPLFRRIPSGNAERISKGSNNFVQIWADWARRLSHWSQMEWWTCTRLPNDGHDFWYARRAL